MKPKKNPAVWQKKFFEALRYLFFLLYALIIAGALYGAASFFKPAARPVTAGNRV